MKEKQIVYVKILGECGTGKTTIAVKLGRMLKQMGIPTDVLEYDASYQDDITEEAIDRNLKALSSKVAVVILTEQVKRHVL